jgi:hypothetical protein
VQSLPKAAAAEMVSFYPPWAAGMAYPAGVKLKYGGKLYEVLQAHTSQADWTPDIVPSLYTEVNETNAGTADDPIPYNGNMRLEAGRYYTQYGTVYRCTRDTGIPVYGELAMMTAFVEVV